MNASREPRPLSPAMPIVECLHGNQIVDPYRWLEDQDSPQTRSWLDAQARYTSAYFSSVPGRNHIEKRISELLLSTTVGPIWIAGEKYFYAKRTPEREQPVIIERNGLRGPELLAVDPAILDRERPVAVSIAAVSHNGRYLAYEVRRGGTDHAMIEILDTGKRRSTGESLPEGFYSGLEFSANGEGFFYLARKPSRFQAETIYFHRFGTKPSQDIALFSPNAEDGAHTSVAFAYAPDLNRMVYTTYLEIGRRTSIYAQSIPDGKLTPLLHLEGACVVPFFASGQLLAVTNFGSENFQVVRIDPDHPGLSHWHVVVPESPWQIGQVASAGARVFVTRINRFSTTIEGFSLDGASKIAIPVSRHGTVNLLNRNCSEASHLFFSYESLTEPPAIYCYDVAEKRGWPWHKPNSVVHNGVVEIQELDYSSRNGTRVPILLAARKSAAASRPRAAFMTAYGGFGACVTPRFSAFITFLLEQGFLVAVPAVRGGSELGESWHQAGKGKNRQNAFDDFIAAAEWLVSSGLADQRRIGIGGGSNAGLLVGAAVTQRPELFRAAICLGPLLDMLRYHLFDRASDWRSEFGSVEDKDEFSALLAYSPYHRVRNGLQYPAMLLVSGDADCRCNPMHARKMTARLQAANTGGRPILLDYKSNWGHAPVQPRTARINALTDRLAFVCHELEVWLGGKGAE